MYVPKYLNTYVKNTGDWTGPDLLYLIYSTNLPIFPRLAPVGMTFWPNPCDNVGTKGPNNNFKMNSVLRSALPGRKEEKPGAEETSDGVRLTRVTIFWGTRPTGPLFLLFLV